MRYHINPARRFAALAMALAVLPLLAVTACSASGRTPSAVEGPFYPTPEMRPADQDNDLARIASMPHDAAGEIVRLRGRVFERDGAAVAGARVEIWQVDNNGRYIHTDDDNHDTPRDPAFQGFGHAMTDAAGAYSFRTINPVLYSGRTPHIHVKVFVGGRERLTTQFYLDGHPDNSGDLLWWWLSEAEREAVTMRFQSAADGTPTASVDILL